MKQSKRTLSKMNSKTVIDKKDIDRYIETLFIIPKVGKRFEQFANLNDFNSSKVQRPIQGDYTRKQRAKD